MEKKLLKSILIIISYCVLLVAVIINIEWIASTLSALLALLSPVFIGFGVAFVLNKPYSAVFSLYSKIGRKNRKEKPIKTQKKVFFLKSDEEKKVRRANNLRKAAALLTVYIIFIAFIVLLVSLVSPEIGKSVSQLTSNIDSYVDNLTSLLNKIGDALPFDLFVADPSFQAEGTDAVLLEPKTVSLTDFLVSKLTETAEKLPEIISGVLPNIFSFTKSLASSVLNWLLGFVMSVYMLASKETLSMQLKRCFYAFVPQKAADKTCEILSVSSDIFSNFVSGRIYDAMIIGLICFIGMSIFGFQYTLLISVVVAVTNVIPIFGPFIGAIPSIFLLLLVDPMQAVWFTVFIIILQQIDGNLIGPKVVGDSIGLPAWWVMFSILIGGGIMGVLGMLIGVPAFAVVYRLLTESIGLRLKNKGLSETIDSHGDTHGQ